MSGYILLTGSTQWSGNASLSDIKASWERLGYRAMDELNALLATSPTTTIETVEVHLARACCLMYEGEPNKAYAELEKVRSLIESEEAVAREWLTTVIYFQGVVGLRRGENDNCIMCRGDSSCILPITAAAVHQDSTGSRLAIRHFTEYLNRFPDDLEVRWLLNLAHMTLGEHPRQVDPRFLISLDDWCRNSNADIGRFRDIGPLVGVNRFNQAGGALMDDFDNDGYLDLVVTSFDPTHAMGFYRNQQDGTFREQTESAGLSEQYGGLTCVQTDFDNNGFPDIYIPRGAWQHSPMRPSLLRNDGQCRFTDVTEEAGLLDPMNSNAAAWADFDNDGWLDLFVCCERQPHRLYRNLGNGTFKDVARSAGVAGTGQFLGKGCTWIDYDNNGFPDLFINYLVGNAELFRNNRDGTFTNVTNPQGIDGPFSGFSCWAWDFDNDGWLDIFATCYDLTLPDVVNGLIGSPHNRFSNRLYRNLNGKGFRDVTKDAGLDLVLAAMGSNYGDFDNDGYLDMYLGTGDPSFSTLIPNRMFKNIAGKEFAEITCSAGVGHLQKGHGIACGDWDRDGNVDIFVQTGGTVPGDKYHNILFQNPGNDHRWVTVKLIGRQSNRAAIGTRIKLVADGGTSPLTVHRHVSSGSSFGGNPLEQTIGLADAPRIALLEIHWPTSGTTQVFRDIPANQFIEITEFADEYRTLDRPPIRLPEQDAHSTGR